MESLSGIAPEGLFPTGQRHGSRSSWHCGSFYCRQSWRNIAMAGTVTIASVRVHGIRQLLVYCLGKREGDWPCHHSGKLPIDRFQAEEVLSDIERRCRCTVCGGGELICGPTTASSKLRGRAVQGG